MTNEPGIAFASALQAWMERERLTAARAARYLVVSQRDLYAWLDGRLPRHEQVMSVLARIAER